MIGKNQFAGSLSPKLNALNNIEPNKIPTITDRTGFSFTNWLICCIITLIVPRRNVYFVELPSLYANWRLFPLLRQLILLSKKSVL